MNCFVPDFSSIFHLNNMLFAILSLFNVQLLRGNVGHQAPWVRLRFRAFVAASFVNQIMQSGAREISRGEERFQRCDCGLLQYSALDCSFATCLCSVDEYNFYFFHDWECSLFHPRFPLCASLLQHKCLIALSSQEKAPYNNHAFQVSLDFPVEYPFKPPQVSLRI